MENEACLVMNLGIGRESIIDASNQCDATGTPWFAYFLPTDASSEDPASARGRVLVLRENCGADAECLAANWLAFQQLLFAGIRNWSVFSKYEPSVPRTISHALWLAIKVVIATLADLLAASAAIRAVLSARNRKAIVTLETTAKIAVNHASIAV